VKLEQQTLDNGTVIEADSFEVGMPVFAIDGDNREPLEIGTYLLADGTTLEVYEIGKIGELASPAAEVEEEELSAEPEEETTEEAPAEEAAPETEVELEAVPATLEEILTKVMESLQPKLEELQAKLDALSGSQTEMKATLSSVSKKATVHKPADSKTNLGKANTGKNISNTEARIMAALSN
jgi:chromosome segregation ATPase